jgi:hypothetical protein
MKKKKKKIKPPAPRLDTPPPNIIPDKRKEIDRRKCRDDKNRPIDEDNY